MHEDLVLAGPATVHLHVESDCPDTDFVARLIELTPDGTARLLMDGVTRAMLRDPAFLADAAKRKAPVSPVSGEELDKIVAAVYKTPPATIAKLKQVFGFK